MNLREKIICINLIFVKRIFKNNSHVVILTRHCRHDDIYRWYGVIIIFQFDGFDFFERTYVSRVKCYLYELYLEEK